MVAPKVFLSHASEDKERFVNNFATSLRQNGVDVWLDKWEMLPGDSLVDKIFEEGIKSAEAIIIIVSKYSIIKKWVKEEINAGFVSRMKNGTKLIPVIIDDCEIPGPLNSTLWIKIKNLEDYENERQEVIKAIFHVTDKPTMGLPPEYTWESIPDIPGLKKQDVLLLKMACDKAMEVGDLYLSTNSITPDFLKRGYNDKALQESLEILEAKGFLRCSKAVVGITSFQILSAGFEEYANVYIDDYVSKIKIVALSILNEKLQHSIKIVEQKRLSITLVKHILNLFENNNFIKLSHYAGGNIGIYNETAQFKRWAEGF
ncbi:MAG: toll/interleukin-1 receptor domain-containing protein [Fibrobacteria bacterium]|nr:toll/interleukin-1 receptor domain-containing protein [Fibrobacteria bacterium]